MNRLLPALRTLFIPALVIITLVLPAPNVTAAEESVEPAFDAGLFKSLKYRNIGPYRGGRSTAVTGVPGDPDTYYMGTTGGGIWKTTDGGVRWTNVSDGELGSASVGALAVGKSDTNVIYAGMGSACIRGNTSPGDGVYRSTDAGETWKSVGLKEAGQIGRIHVHPSNPDIVYVAAVGHAFGPNEERGVFRSRDGGATWEKVLYVSDTVGAVDLAMDPKNPRILFAATWRAERKPWTSISGGEGSGLHRSTDSGDTWEEVTEGLPEGIKGKIGVTISGADSSRVYALVEAEKGGLFRSDDGGKKFRLINPDRNFIQRAWYYTHVYADPKDRNTVYILNTGIWRSHDAGKEFEYIRAPHGDEHDLWINPDNPRVLINANDGGANVSYNGGRSWSTQANQPTSEMYRVSVDRQFPYRVYGCQQDNSCVSLPSRTSSGSIARQDWWVIGGCESGHVAIDPRNPEITYSGCYGGNIDRYDHATGQARAIMIYPQVAVGQATRDLKYRFQWNAPIRLSPQNPGVLYHTSQYVHRTIDEGQSWTTISPDLTRNDDEKQGFAGEPITRDNTGVEVYGTIFAFEPSPHEEELLWAGTDDGRVHISRDEGGAWEEITPSKMPEWGTVNAIELSPHDAGRAFLAVHRYRMDDFTPYIFRTNDYGKSWDLITDGKNGIPADHFVRVVREDPNRKGLLYAGTEFGMYISFDDGKRWQSFQQELPLTPITDMVITQNDLVVATQGRSFWIMDDLTPLHSLNKSAAKAELHLFRPRAAYRFGGGISFGGGGGGKNPPGGVMVRYLLDRDLNAEEGKTDDEKEAEELTLEILDGEGKVLRKLSSTQEEPQAPNPWRRFIGDVGGARKLPAKEGMNQYVWNLRLHDAELVDDSVLWGLARGPIVPPGTYTARLTLGETVLTHTFDVRGDPRIHSIPADSQAQYELSRKIWSSLTESHTAWKQIMDIREQIEGLSNRLEEKEGYEDVAEAAEAVTGKLKPIEEAIHQLKAESSQDILNFTPMLDNQFLGLMGTVESADARPTDGSLQLYEELRAQLDDLLGRLDQVKNSELAAFNKLVGSKNVPAVVIPAGK
jgi:photosystem II stability/assembly factor-like uncharacterized protein